MLAVVEILMQRKFQHAVFRALERRRQFERGRMIAAHLRRDRPAVVGLGRGVAIDRPIHIVAALAERGLGILQLDVGITGRFGGEQPHRVDRQHALLVIDKDPQAGQLRIGRDRNRRRNRAAVAGRQRAPHRAGVVERRLPWPSTIER